MLSLFGINVVVYFMKILSSSRIFCCSYDKGFWQARIILDTNTIFEIICDRLICRITQGPAFDTGIVESEYSIKDESIKVRVVQGGCGSQFTAGGKQFLNSLVLKNQLHLYLHNCLFTDLSCSVR